MTKSQFPDSPGAAPETAGARAKAEPGSAHRRPASRPRRLPARRLLAVAAALALVVGPADAQFSKGTGSHSNKGRRAASLDGSEPACPLGSYRCAPRPDNFAICRPNAMLEFYDPTLTKDTSLRESANTNARSERVDSSDQNVYHLSGNVFLERADQRIQSDLADYNNQTTDYDARGNVRYQESGQLISADHITGNNDASHGIATGNVRYQMLASHGNGTALRGEMLDAQHSRYDMASYSTCDIGHHWWEFRARSITIDKDTGVGVARHATMRAGGVPFLYLPRFSFPVDNRRKSGFLYPMMGNTSRSGFMVSAPYYFNLAPNYDATLDPRIYTERGEMLAGEFRYMVPGSQGLVDLEYLPSDHGDNNALSDTKTKGDDRYLLKLVNSTHLWDSWSWVTNINHASDKNYLHDFGNDLLTGGAISTLTSSSYVVGGGNWWNASLGVDHYQNVNPYLPDYVIQYDRLPHATLNLNIPLTRWLEFGMNNDAAAFRKEDSVEGQRLDLYPYLAADFRGAAWYVRPKLAYRYTAYDLNNGYQNFGYGAGRLAAGVASPFTTSSPARSLPVASVDSGLIFERSTSLFGDSYTQTLEPRAYYLYVPYRNQNNLPLFDTNLMSFDYWSLFTPNQFSGADRQSNANNLTLAVTSRFLDDGGVERISASLGQIRYFTPQKVLVPGTAQTDYAGSDYVAQFNMQLNDRWKLNTEYEWSPHYRRTDLATAELQMRLKNDGILNFSYRYRRNLTGTYVDQLGNPIPFNAVGIPIPESVKGRLIAPSAQLEQYDASFVYPISDRWRVLGRGIWSVHDHQIIEALAGVEYDSCCVAFRVVERRYASGYNPLAPPSDTSRFDNAIMFEIEFKGVGAFNSQTEDLLHRDILGYQ